MACDFAVDARRELAANEDVHACGLGLRVEMKEVAKLGMSR